MSELQTADKFIKNSDSKFVKEWPGLVGSKIAIQRGGVLYVSPAMMVLIRDCTNMEELTALLSNIPYQVYSMQRPLPKG